MEIKRPTGVGATDDQIAAVSENASTVSDGDYISVPKNMLRPDPDQPRKAFSSEMLEERQSQLEEFGQLKPLIVKPLTSDEDGNYYPIIDGECRWRATMNSELIDSLDVRVEHEKGNDQLRILLKQAIANDEGSASLTPLERSELYYRLSILSGSQAAAAGKLSKSESEFSRIIKLRNLPVYSHEFAASGEITDVKVLAKLGDIENHDPDLAQEVINQLRLNETKRKNDNESVATARHVVTEVHKNIKSKNKPGKKQKKIKKVRAVPLRDIRLIQAGSNYVLEIDRAKENLRFNLTDEQYVQLKSKILEQNS